jgi:DNA polymerase III subunit alpha
VIVPLHNHSEFSALDGMATVDEIARRVHGLECPACGLSDHGVVSGHLDFAKAMTKVGIKPVFGCEMYHGTKTTGFKGNERDQHHLVVLAMTDEGLRNLWRLTNATSDAAHFRNVGRVFWDDLKKYREGLVVTSACALGMVPKQLLQGEYTALDKYLDIFGDNFYIEIHTYPIDKAFSDRDAGDTDVLNMQVINEQLVAVAQERGIPMVYANDAHYAFPEQAELHDVYLALQTGQSIYTPIQDRKMWHPPGALEIKSEDSVRESLRYLPDSVVQEALDNSCAIGERASAQLPEVRRHMPMFVPADCPFLNQQEDITAEQLFIDLVTEGIERRYGDDPGDEVWDRVAYEAETLMSDGIHHYFLWGWDEAMFADIEGIGRGPGRGSSAGCIIAYALGITDVDPLHYGLIFERFWNSGRTDGFPDIDSDFSQARRQEVISYLEDRLGQGRVRQIGTVGRMKPKAVVDRVARGCNISRDECEELKTIISKTPDIEIHGVDQIGWTRELEPDKVIYIEDHVGDEIEKWVGSRDARERFVRMCKNMCSRIQLYGVHPSGVVISDVELADELPAYRRGGKDGIAATQFPMSDVDYRQFLKLDVLGLRTLDTLEIWRQLMHDKGVEINWSGLDLEEHPEEMWKLLHDGYAAGIFQVERGIPKRLCELMEVRSVDDLAAVTALIRPGPQGDGTADKYLARRSGEEPVTYPHPRFEELMSKHLADTYGLFVYQEQVINYFNELGYTLGESDAVRKILGKKKPEALEALYDGSGEWKGRGYMTMAEAAGLPQTVAQGVWEGLERFASYSFNLSHAVCYGVLGFRCLFAKYYGPGQFYAACIRTAEGPKRHEMLPLYVNEARRLGLDILPPDIAESQALTAVDSEGNLLFGFSDVKGVGESGDYVCELREQLDYSTPEIFYDQFEELNKAYLKRKKDLKKALSKGDNVTALAIQTELDLRPRSPKQRLSSGKIEALYKAGAWDSIMPTAITMIDRQELETELLGVILTDYTREAFEANADQLEDLDDFEEVKRPFMTKAEECELDLSDSDAGFVYKVPGIVVGAEEKRGKKSGKSFGIVTIEYGADTLQFMVFNYQWKSNKFLFRIRTPGIFEVKHQPPTDWGESYILAKGKALKP